MTQDTGPTSPHPPPVDRLSQLWQRINAHKMVQWCVAYVALAYAVQHAVVLTGEAFEWPPEVLRVSMLLMVLGLPVVVTLAWYHGERASRHFSAGELTIISLLLVIGSVVFYAFVQPNAEIAADQAPPAQQDGVNKARGAAESPATAVSLAVLPFANLSGDPSQEFFSDGMTEEITAALAKIPDLRVVARGSAFQFKDEKRDRRAVGQALGATHLIEGSVRKEGDRVRITAQLVEANGGVNVWTESYDRQLAGVFATQEDIATAIAGALRMPLGLRPGESLVSSRNVDQESYLQYLRAKALYQGRVGGGGLKALNDAIALLEPVVARNPNYAPAWALLANVHDTAPNYSPEILTNRTNSVEEIRRVVQSAMSKAEPAARRAIQLDPNIADGYRTLAYMQGRAGKLLQEEELRLKALSLDPNNAETLAAYSGFLARVGRVKEALGVQQQAQELEPFIPIVNRDLGLVLWLNGQDDAAIVVLRKLPNPRLIAMIQAAAGRYDEAADTLQSGRLPPGFPMDVVPEAVRLLRMAPTPVASPQSVKGLRGLEFVYLYVGAPGQVLENFEVDVEAGWRTFNHRLLSHPSFGSARKTERYKAYARKAGLVDYWRVKGWPDFCRPVGADDFACN